MDNSITDNLITFPISELAALGAEHAAAYKAAKPWPHIVIDDFLPDHLARNILNAFPGPDHDCWLDWEKRNIVNQPRKQGIGRASRLENVSPYIVHALSAFLTFPFVNFISELTGIRKLIPDPYFHGGGLHQILPGGHLSIHTDYNLLKPLGLYRRVNVLYYLNDNWQADYDGDLELWDAEDRTCAKSIAPLFNRLVVFDTTKKTLHGHPKPLKMPPSETRKSLAFYYYTAEPVKGEVYDMQTDWLDVEPS